MNPTTIISAFDRFCEELVSDWHHHYHQYHRYGLDTLRYFPEPYFGNLHSGAGLKAVFINLNPGAGGPIQDITNPNSLFIKEYRSHGMNYAQTVKAIVHQHSSSDTVKWWAGKRLNWYNQSFGMRATFNEIIGLEMLPWHSTGFGEAQALTSCAYYLQTLLAAAALAKTIVQPKPHKNGKPVIFCKGGLFKELLIEKKCAQSNAGFRLEAVQQKRVGLNGATEIYQVDGVRVLKPATGNLLPGVEPDEVLDVIFLIFSGGRGMQFPRWDSSYLQ